MERAVERRRRRARARRGSARIAVELPWVARERVMARQARRQHAVVGHRRLGEDDRPRLAQPRRRRGVRLGRRHLARRRADRRRLAAGRDIVLDRDRHAVKRPDRLALRPARLGDARLLKRPLRSVEPSRMNVRLERFHAFKHRSHCLDRRELARPVSANEVQRRHPEGLHGSALRRRARAPAHCQDSAERSLTKIGAFFHRPLSLASATVTFGNWNRKALTQSSASFFCASPSAAL
jgi:hypothetical protein